MLDAVQDASCRSPDAAQRAALAAWCAADPGSIVPLAQLWVPACMGQRKSAAPRPRHERKLREVICPSGGLLTGVSSPFCKNISLHPSGKSSLQIRAIPPHQRGVSRSSRTRGADAVDAAASCARWDRRVDREICERSPARGREMLLADGKIVWS